MYFNAIFSQFDGNNILFLVWILLVILPFYDIEGKGIKVHRKEMREVEDTKEKLDNRDAEFQIEKLEDFRKMATSQPKLRIRVFGKL